MRDLARAAAVVLALTGIVWVLQGLDFSFAPKSFMTGNPVWVLWGAVAILAAGALMWMGRSKRR